MYKLVVFDLDGTIADTLQDLANAVNAALIMNGLKKHSIDEYRYMVGNGADRLVRLAVGEHIADDDLCIRIKSQFSRYYAEHICDFTKPYIGVADTLAELSAAGVRTAVLSNKPHEFVPHIVSTLYPDHSFDYAWGQQSKFERKPSPQALNCIIDLCGVSKEDAIYVGDSDVDVATAHNADISVIGVEWGFRGKQELSDAGADYIVSTPADLTKIVLDK